MKNGTVNLLKFKLMKQGLDLRHYQAVGLLESLWLFAELNTKLGDIGKFTNDEIAFSLEYDGDADALIDALCKNGWIDRHAEHRLVIVGWPKHRSLAQF